MKTSKLLVPLLMILGLLVAAPPPAVAEAHDAFYSSLRVRHHGWCVISKSDAKVRARLRCQDDYRTTLRPCPQEDSRRCFWHAPSRGNGIGRSFVFLHGRVAYFRG